MFILGIRSRLGFFQRGIFEFSRSIGLEFVCQINSGLAFFFEWGLSVVLGICYFTWVFNVECFSLVEVVFFFFRVINDFVYRLGYIMFLLRDAGVVQFGICFQKFSGLFGKECFLSGFVGLVFSMWGFEYCFFVIVFLLGYQIFLDVACIEGLVVIRSGIWYMCRQRFGRCVNVIVCCSVSVLIFRFSVGTEFLSLSVGGLRLVQDGFKGSRKVEGIGSMGSRVNIVSSAQQRVGNVLFFRLFMKTR